MPIYEYRCADCAHELEIMQKMSEDALTQCPQCGHHSLNKLISRSSFRLKGGGWYETDFKNQTPAQKTITPSTEGKDTAAPQTTTPQDKAPVAESPVKTEAKTEKPAPVQKTSTTGDK